MVQCIWAERWQKRGIPLTIKVVHEAFGSMGVVITWVFAASFLVVVGMMFWRQRECAAAAEMGRKEVHLNPPGGLRRARN
jgi:hypothetical protein